MGIQGFLPTSRGCGGFAHLCVQFSQTPMWACRGFLQSHGVATMLDPGCSKKPLPDRDCIRDPKSNAEASALSLRGFKVEDGLADDDDNTGSPGSSFGVSVYDEQHGLGFRF